MNLVRSVIVSAHILVNTAATRLANNADSSSVPYEPRSGSGNKKIVSMETLTKQQQAQSAGPREIVEIHAVCELFRGSSSVTITKNSPVDAPSTSSSNCRVGNDSSSSSSTVIRNTLSLPEDLSVLQMIVVFNEIAKSLGMVIVGSLVSLGTKAGSIDTTTADTIMSSSSSSNYGKGKFSSSSSESKEKSDKKKLLVWTQDHVFAALQIRSAVVMAASAVASSSKDNVDDFKSFVVLR